jgi:hypothetical protein
MKFRLFRMTFFFACLGVAIPIALLGQDAGCVSPTDTRARLYRAAYGGMVSGTDPGYVAQRTNLGLPTLSASQVIVVTDTTTCRIASAAYDHELDVSAPSEAPLVLQLGTQYVVVKRLDSDGGRISVLFNQDFTIAQKRIWN